MKGCGKRERNISKSSSSLSCAGLAVVHTIHAKWSGQDLPQVSLEIAIVYKKKTFCVM